MSERCTGHRGARLKVSGCTCATVRAHMILDIASTTGARVYPALMFPFSTGRSIPRDTSRRDGLSKTAKLPRED